MPQKTPAPGLPEHLTVSISEELADALLLSCGAGRHDYFTLLGVSRRAPSPEEIEYAMKGAERGLRRLIRDRELGAEAKKLQDRFKEVSQALRDAKSIADYRRECEAAPKRAQMSLLRQFDDEVQEVVEQRGVSWKTIEYLRGRAEHLGLKSGLADTVLLDLEEQLDLPKTEDGINSRAASSQSEKDGEPIKVPTAPEDSAWNPEVDTKMGMESGPKKGLPKADAFAALAQETSNDARPGNDSHSGRDTDNRPAKLVSLPDDDVSRIFDEPDDSAPAAAQTGAANTLSDVFESEVPPASSPADAGFDPNPFGEPLTGAGPEKPPIPQQPSAADRASMAEEPTIAEANWLEALEKEQKKEAAPDSAPDFGGGQLSGFSQMLAELEIEGEAIHTPPPVPEKQPSGGRHRLEPDATGREAFEITAKSITGFSSKRMSPTLGFAVHPDLFQVYGHSQSQTLRLLQDYGHLRITSQDGTVGGDASASPEAAQAPIGSPVSYSKPTIPIQKAPKKKSAPKETTAGPTEIDSKPVVPQSDAQAGGTAGMAVIDEVLGDLKPSGTARPSKKRSDSAASLAPPKSGLEGDSPFEEEPETEYAGSAAKSGGSFGSEWGLLIMVIVLFVVVGGLVYWVFTDFQATGPGATGAGASGTGSGSTTAGASTSPQGSQDGSFQTASTQGSGSNFGSPGFTPDAGGGSTDAFGDPVASSGDALPNPFANAAARISGEAGGAGAAMMSPPTRPVQRLELPKDPAFPDTLIALPQGYYGSQFLPAFSIRAHEVTVAEYARFIQATGYPPPSVWVGGNPPSGSDTLPVGGVSGNDARRYCEWRQTVDRLPEGERYELPTMAQAAGLLLPMSDQMLAAQIGQQNPVATIAQNGDRITFREGTIYHLLGNVAEWVLAPSQGPSPVYAVAGYGYDEMANPSSAVIRQGGQIPTIAENTGFRYVKMKLR